jgi:protein-tyrosine-phosphatase
VSRPDVPRVLFLCTGNSARSQDPAAVSGEASARRAAFERGYRELEPRIEALARLPIDRLDGPALRARVERLADAERRDEERR